MRDLVRSGGLGDVYKSEAWGEATHFGAEAEIARLVDYLNACVRQAPVRGLSSLQALLVQSEMSPARRAVFSACEQAHLDAVARSSGHSIAAHLGGEHREMVPFYANINRGIADRSPDGFAAQAKRIVAETGANAVKIAPFDGLRWQSCSPLQVPVPYTHLPLPTKRIV